MTEYSSTVRRTAYAIIGSILCSLLFLGLEALFRFNPEYGRPGFQFDKRLIWRLHAGLTAQKAYAMGQVPEREPFVLRFNRQGFRGYEFRKKKMPGTTRILLVGDSYTAGLDYPDGEVFADLLERRLNEGARGTDYEVFNASCPAWGMDQYYVYLTEEGLSYQPDYVIVVSAPNDFREMYNKGLVEVDDRANIIVHRAWLPHKERFGWWLATQFSFFQFLQQKVFHSTYGDFFRLFRYYSVNYGKQDSADWNIPLYLEQPFQEVLESDRMYEALLAGLKSRCEEQGAALLLAKIPNRWEFDGSYDREGLDPDRMWKVMGAAAEGRRIPFLNLNEKLKAEDEPLRIFMAWEYHFNRAGHDFAAEHLYDFFKDNENE